MRSQLWSVALPALLVAGSSRADEAIVSVRDVSGVPTFECVGIYCSYQGDDNQNSQCGVRYRVKGSAQWRQGHPLWADRDERQYRGSLVHLEPGTAYEVELAYTDPDGGSGSARLEVTTWNERFGEGEITTVSDRTAPLEIRDSGTPSAYRVYQPAPGKSATIDVANASPTCVRIDADHVIVRGLKLTGARNHGILVAGGRHDVIIEDCEITNWGPAGIGRDQYDRKKRHFDYGRASGIFVARDGAHRIIVQRNRIHHPRGRSNTWENKIHPAGPQAISFIQSAGNNVIRYNHCYSELGHYYNDIIGGGGNPKSGNMKQDSDVYCNIVSHCWDDGLEIEGHNTNVRIWGNVIHDCNVAIATAGTGLVRGANNFFGPCYIWRNLIYEGWHSPKNRPSLDGKRPYMSRAQKLLGWGAIYYYHNTILKIPGEIHGTMSAVVPLGARDGRTRYFTARNNILDTRWGIFGARDDAPHPTHDFDYNLYGRERSEVKYLPPSLEKHGVFAQPSYRKIGAYSYVLGKGSPGVDQAARIPNFNDSFTGAGPDVGACEPDAYLMGVGPERRH